MTARRWFAVLIGAVLFAQGNAALANDKNKVVRFGALEAPAAETTRASALAWLKNADATKMQQAEALWRQEERSVLERLADTFALGNAQAAQLLRDANNPLAPAPTAMPAILKDARQPIFFRANLGLAYARALSARRVHEEALESLALFRAEQTADPAAYLFHRAVCEHALLHRDDASRSIGRLLGQALDSPERYKTVGALMLLDMQTWKDKDLGTIARKMGNIERRLDLARGGPQTQKQQREVILRLDELIKELENKAKQQQQGSSPNGGSCPDGSQPQPGQQGGANPTRPMEKSQIATNGGSGRVDPARLRKLAEGWGKMNEAQRAQAMQEVADLTRGLSLAHQEQYRDYFRRLTEDALRRNGGIR